MTGDRESSISRWSRRKSKARRRGSATPRVTEEAERSGAMPHDMRPADPQGVASPDDGAVAADVNEDRSVEAEAETVEALAQEHGLPDIESLDKESDFTQFMKEGVPAVVKRAALRKLWLSDPVFANLDKLNDYDEDFRIAKGAVEAVQTSYKVGRGYLRDLEDDIAGESVEIEREDLDSTEGSVEAERVSQTENGDAETKMHESDTSYDLNNSNENLRHVELASNAGNSSDDSS